MAEHIYTYSTSVRSADGFEYEIRVYGEARGDGMWFGWLEFHPRRGSGSVLRTDQETSQPNRQALEYWAGGLEPTYFEGALNRARP
jgi:hypothetical protein